MGIGIVEPSVREREVALADGPDGAPFGFGNVAQERRRPVRTARDRRSRQRPARALRRRTTPARGTRCPRRARWPRCRRRPWPGTSGRTGPCSARRARSPRGGQHPERVDPARDRRAARPLPRQDAGTRESARRPRRERSRRPTSGQARPAPGSARASALHPARRWRSCGRPPSRRCAGPVPRRRAGAAAPLPRPWLRMSASLPASMYAARESSSRSTARSGATELTSRAAARSSADGRRAAAGRRRQARAEPEPSHPLDHVVGARIVEEHRVGPVEEPAGAAAIPASMSATGGLPEPPGRVDRRRRQPAGQLPRAGGDGRRAASRRHLGGVVEAAGHVLVRPDRRRGRGATPAPASSLRERVGERPVGGPPVGAGRVVVRRRPHQRVAERDPIALEMHDATAPRPAPAR